MHFLCIVVYCSYLKLYTTLPVPKLAALMEKVRLLFVTVCMVYTLEGVSGLDLLAMFPRLDAAAFAAFSLRSGAGYTQLQHFLL